LSAPYVGQGNAEVFGGDGGGCVTVGNGCVATVVESVGDRRAIPHALSAPAAATTARAAKLRRVKTS
jgi:hypothetical protein